MRINTLLASLVLSFSTIVSVGCATDAGDEFSETEDEAALAGKLTFSQGSDGQFRFNLKSGNGSILLTSEGYTSRTGAINGALSVLENGVDKAMYRVVPAKTKGHLIHLVAGNGEIIGFSEVYATKSSATRAVTSSVKAVTSYLDKREAATGKRVDVLVGETGKFRFNVIATNGQIVLSSEQYESEAAAFNGAMAVQAVSQDAGAYTVKANASGSGFFFTVSANNGQIIGVSQQYTTKASAESAVASLKKLMPAITVL